MTMSTTPAQRPTVPSCQISSAPNTMPKIVQLIDRPRATSRSIAVRSRGRGLSAVFAGSASAPPPCAAATGSGASPFTGELSDSGLDLIKGDMAQPALRDDLLTIYHDVGNSARRQRIHHVL